MSVTDLTGTKWKFTSGKSVITPDGQYGNGIITISTPGYSYTTSEPYNYLYSNYNNYIEFECNSSNTEGNNKSRCTANSNWNYTVNDSTFYLPFPIYLEFSSGTCCTNTTLISWLETNATQIIGYEVTAIIDNCTLSPTQVSKGQSYTGTLTPATGYTSPDFISDGKFTYRVVNNQFTIPSDNISGDLYLYDRAESGYKNIQMHPISNGELDTNVNLYPKTKLEDLLDISVTAAQLNYMQGATSNIQTQINDKAVVSISDTGTSADEVSFIKVNGVEKRLPGGYNISYEAASNGSNFATDSWSTIASAIKSGSDHYQLGDSKTDTINIDGTEYEVVFKIVDNTVGRYISRTGSTTHKVIETQSVVGKNNYEKITYDVAIDQFYNSTLYKALNENIINYLPNELQNELGDVILDYSSEQPSCCKLFCPSSGEYYGDVTGVTQYTWYSQQGVTKSSYSALIKNNLFANTASQYKLRDSANYIVNTNGSYYNSSSDCSTAICFAW